MDFIQLIGSIVAGIVWFSFILLLNLFILPFMWIGPWIWTKVGIYGSYQEDGIKLYRSNKRFFKLIAWCESKN
jgi:hypothetical protein